MAVNEVIEKEKKVSKRGAPPLEPKLQQNGQEQNGETGGADDKIDLDNIIDKAKKTGGAKGDKEPKGEKEPKEPKEPGDENPNYELPKLDFLVEIIDGLQSELCSTLAKSTNKRPSKDFKLGPEHRQQLHDVLIDTAPQILIWLATNPYGKAILFFGGLGVTQFKKIKEPAPKPEPTGENAK